MTPITSQHQAKNLEQPTIRRESELYACLGGKSIESISCFKCNMMDSITTTNPKETVKYFYCFSTIEAKRLFLKVNK